MRKLKEKIGWLLTMFLTAFTAPQLQAQEEGLRLHLDFENVTGTSVPDAASSGIKASLKNSAKVVEMGKYHVLDLGNSSGYLDLTSQAGTLFKGLDTYTLSMYNRVDETASLTGNGYSLWTFSTSEACTASEGKYSAYRLNVQRFANSTGGYASETGFEVGTESEKGKWIHVLYKQNGAKGQLYLNGVLKGAGNAMPLNSANFTSDIPYSWIGRPAFSGDSYLAQTLVCDIRLYDRELSAAEITALAAQTDDLDYEYRYGTTGDFSTLQQEIEQAKQILGGISPTDYPQAATDQYRDVIKLALSILKEGRASQTLIDKQIAQLQEAQKTFEQSRGFVFDEESATSGYDTDRGFKHPGGLHTQADFDRIRKQLDERNTKVTAAYNILQNAESAQSNCATWPVVTIIRGGGVGENYINAARGATIAYQNGLRWQIDGSREHAQHAVDVLMSWARTTTGIGGDSNYALAAGLYGYEFAQAAELVRDYDGWSKEDFEEFKRWMMNVWYPSCIGFLRGRNGTWENAANIPAAGYGKQGQRPGHYWSNWGLCNVLAVMSIGILCDDVFIYNQGLSFYKYDQAGTYTQNRGESIDNDGLTDFLGNLVPVVADDDRGAYGQLGQMQESGRDQGHATMAAGLAVDICQIAYNQGDDLYSYMDNRLAAGLEFIAAYNNGGVEAEDLPWTTYRYADCRTAWHNAWVQTGPNPGERGAARPYWGRVIGHYEGVKGVKMKYSEMALEQMGIDGGGLGGTSGGYDHLGYSVLTCTRDAITPDQAPTLLTPLMEYNGTSVEHNELGGLRNTYLIEPTTALPAGTLVTLSPQLPKGTADTGQWKWNTGEHTKDLTVAANRSKVYRVTYTNANGVESEQVFTLAVEGDCAESEVETYITTNGVRTAGDSATVMYGDAVTLEIYGRTGWGYYSWENGATTATVTLPAVTTSRDISAFFISQGGRKNKVTFHLNVQSQRPDFILNGQTYTDSLVVIAAAGSDVTLAPTPSDAQTYGTWQWSDGSTASSLTLENLQTSGEYTVRYTVDETTYSCTYRIYVKDENYRLPEAGDYYIRYLPDDTYLTNLNGTGTSPVFAVRNEASPSSQQWHIENTSGVSTYSIQSLRDSTGLNKEGTLVARPLKAFRFSGVAESDRLAIQKSVTSGPKYWYVKADGSIDFAATEDATDYPFELIAVEGGNSINQPTADGNKKITAVTYYTPGGIRMNHPSRGINIRQTIYADGETKQDKIVIR